MSATDGDVLGQWPAIEELALTRSKGLPVHELLRNAKPSAYDSELDTLKQRMHSPSLIQEENCQMSFSLC